MSSGGQVLDINDIKDQNDLLSIEIRFAQNLLKLLENYRNLLNICLTNCQKCGQNEVLVNEYNELEVTYNRDLLFAKDLAFNKNNGFYRKLNQLFAGAVKEEAAPEESRVQLIDDYIDSESDSALSQRVVDSDYEPLEDNDGGAGDEGDGRRRRRRKGVSKRTKARVKYESFDTNNSGLNDLIEEIDEFIDNFDDDSEDSEPMAVDNAWNPKKSNRGRKPGKKGAKSVKKVKTKRKKYDKLYKCDSCEYTHKKLPNLESHKNKVHLKVRPFKCDKCEKTFTGKPFLDKHKRFHSETYHHCDWKGCTFKTKYMNNLKEHKLRHAGDRTFKCCWPGCGAQFYNNRDQTQHMKSHEESRDYRCDWPGCEATFKRHTYLSRHRQLHINPDTAFPCNWNGCGKSYNTKKKLENHLTTHRKHMQTSAQPPELRTAPPMPLALPAPPQPQQQPHQPPMPPCVGQQSSGVHQPMIRADHTVCAPPPPPPSTLPSMIPPPMDRTSQMANNAMFGADTRPTDLSNQRQLQQMSYAFNLNNFLHY